MTYRELTFKAQPMEIILTGIILPIVVSFLTTFLFNLFAERKMRRMYSLLGVELLTILIDEIYTGHKIIIEPLHPIKNNPQPNPLPFKSWNGISTIQDEILLRIFEVSKDVPDYDYHPSRIRIHTKNYYEYIINNWEKWFKKCGYHPF